MTKTIKSTIEELAHSAYLTAHAPGYTKMDGRTYKKAVDQALAEIEDLIEQAYDKTPRIDKYKVGDEYINGYDAGVEALRANLKELLK